MPAAAGAVRTAGAFSADMRAEAERERPQQTGHIDGPLTMLTILLLLVGLVCLFSASYAVAYAYEDGNSTYYIFRQGVFAVLPVAVDIAQVVDVEHRGRQQTAGGRRQEQRRDHRMRL